VDVPEGTVADVMCWVDDDPARARAALDEERANANRVSLINQLEPIADREDRQEGNPVASTSSSTELEPTTNEETGLVEDDEGREPYPEGNAPGPLPPAAEDIELDPRNRSVVVGPRNARHADVEYPDNTYDLVEASDEDDAPTDPPAAAAVDFFQVMSDNGVVVLRLDDGAFLFDHNQAIALARDLRQALANVTY
jgi:hypothetical protein